MNATRTGPRPLKLCAIALVCGVLVSTTAAAKNYKIQNGSSAGSSITSLFSFSEVGGDSKSNLSTFQGRDTLGAQHGQIVADYDSGGACAAAPSAEFHVENARGVLSYKRGQLFLVADDTNSPNDGCLVFLAAPPGPAQVSLTVEYDIVGGTGDFEGASGKLTSTSTGTLLYNDLDPGDDNQFGSFESTYEGWFSTP